MTRVLVTGGTGLLGRHLVQALLDRGDDLRVLAFPAENTEWMEARGVDVHRGDIRHAESLTEPMRGVDGVFHVAGMTGVWKPWPDYRAVNVTGTENVCKAALKAGVRRLVHISSWTVYGMSSRRPAIEDQPLTPLNEPHCVTKAQGDRLVQRLVRTEGLPAVIVRPGTFIGPGDRLHFGRVADRLRAGTWITIGAGHNALPLVYVTDVVEGLLLAFDNPQAVGQAYNITNDQPLTQDEAWHAIATELGVRPPRIRLPYLPLAAASYSTELFAKLTRARKPLLTRLGVMLFGCDNRHSIEKARRQLGYEPRVPISKAIHLTAEWYAGEKTKTEARFSPGSASSVGASPALRR